MLMSFMRNFLFGGIATQGVVSVPPPSAWISRRRVGGNEMIPPRNPVPSYEVHFAWYLVVFMVLVFFVCFDQIHSTLG